MANPIVGGGMFSSGLKYSFSRSVNQRNLFNSVSKSTKHENEYESAW